MRRSLRVFAFGAALTLAMLAAAANEGDPVEHLQVAAETDDTALALVRELTATIGPRMTGTANEAQARRWAERHMRDIGLANVRSEEFTLDLWQRGAEAANLIAPVDRPLVIAGIGRTVATPEGGITAPVVRVESMEALRSLSEGALDGAIAFVDGPDFEPSRLGEGFGPGAARIRRAPSEAARRGAVAVLVRSALSGNRRIAHAALLTYADDAPKIPAAVISNPDADALRALAGAGCDMVVTLDLQPEMGKDLVSGNVIGEIAGTDLADEIVLLGAHIDSWDLGEGALDDAAGVGIMLGVARLIAGLPERPRRTIRIVLFGAEEVSLAGARHYADRHGGDNHVIGVESDYGAGRVWGLYSNVPDTMLPVLDVIHAQLVPLGIERGHNRALGGEDLTFLRQNGMPVVSLVQEATRYFDVYHSQDDSFALIDAADLRQNVAAFATFAWLAANVDLPQDK
jgi:hypothetical protein